MGRLVSANIVPSARSAIPVGFSNASIQALNSDVGLPDKPATRPGDDSYAERIIKYVPTEVIAFFIAADHMFPSPDEAAAANCTPASGLNCLIAEHAWPVALVIFLIGLTATPLYIWQQRGTDQPWVVHAVTATVAFAIWAYVVHAHVFVARVYDASVAGFLVLLFTLASGLVVPRKKAE